MEKNNLSGIQRLIKYLKIEFLVDKGVDFILIFIGLYAALSLESSIHENKNKEKYIQDLKNMYVEVSKNKITSMSMEGIVNTNSEVAKEVFSFFLNPSSEPPVHYVDVVEDSKFYYNNFNIMFLFF